MAPETPRFLSSDVAVCRREWLPFSNDRDRPNVADVALLKEAGMPVLVKNTVHLEGKGLWIFDPDQKMGDFLPERAKSSLKLR